MRLLDLAHRARRLPGREIRQALLAAWLLGCANLAVKCLPFSRVIALGSVPVEPGSDPASEVVTEWVTAVKRASRAVPWRTVCIHEGLALQRLLRSRGVPALLCYGTTQKDGELKSHVWVKVGNEEVIGGEEAGGYQLLAVYP